MKLNMITLAILVLFLVVIGLHAREVHWTAQRVVGAAIAGVSVLLVIVARLQLGASFSVRAKARKLVTTGLYAKIRNPIYVFALLAFLGVVIFLGKWILLVLMAAIAAMQMARARNEERVLTEAFGEEYLRYKAQTWF